ncbi:restriction endonuclease subunit S [Anaerolineae bacterium CFX9]|nr:restriction endonuclease subunit S [Anaerolineae bacterium CFX9]
MDGGDTQYKTLNRVELGDIIVNKIWARNGSVSVVWEDTAGCYASGEFPLFVPDQAQLDPRWFFYLTKTPDFWRQCEVKSFGTSGKNRIRPEKFLEIEIPLPPLDEQQRIVAHIDALAEQITAARGLRHSAVDEAIGLLRAILFFEADWQPVPTRMSELVKQRPLNVQVEQEETYRFAGVYSFGRGVFAGSVKSGSEFKYTQLATLHTNNFIYPKLMAWEGAFGVVPPECDGLVVSPEFPVFEIDQSRVLPEVLDVYFKTPLVWPAMAALSTGTNVRRRRLHPNAFLSYQFPLPPMDVQLELRAAKSELERVVRLHNDAVAELDALLPSLLDRAFRGEL